MLRDTQVDPDTVDNSLVEFRRLLRDRPFVPPFWLSRGELQTLAGSLAKRRYPWGWKLCQEEDIDLSDGSRIKTVCVWRSPSSPTLVAIHGMGGSSNSTYMQGLSHKAYREGWNAVLLNLHNRNRAISPPKIYHAGASAEVAEILEVVTERHGLKELFLVGASMGGNILLKMLGKWGSNSPVQVRAAAAISPLVDLTKSCQMLERRSNLIFQRHFVKKLKRMVRERSSELNSFVDLDAISRVRTVRQFDRLLTVPLTQFRNVMDYYRKASALPNLKNIQVPTLVLHARDDPLLPWESFELPEVRSNPWLLVCLTSRGGHLGFLEHRDLGDIDRRWAENRAIDYFRFSKESTP